MRRRGCVIRFQKKRMNLSWVVSSVIARIPLNNHRQVIIGEIRVLVVGKTLICHIMCAATEVRRARKFYSAHCDLIVPAHPCPQTAKQKPHILAQTRAVTTSLYASTTGFPIVIGGSRVRDNEMEWLQEAVNG